MILSNPNSRFKINVKPTDYVLEIGGGHNPHPRADVVVDKYVDSHQHRSGEIKVLKHQHFLHADGESLPFPDNHFDYAICCHVLEHVENPTRFLKEMFRVAKKGYIEVPSLMGEYLAPKASHKWVCYLHQQKLIIAEKEKVGMSEFPMDAGDVFLYHLPKQSLAYKVLINTKPDLLTVRIEWEDQFSFEVLEEETTLPGTKNGRWLPSFIEAQFPTRSITAELIAFTKGLGRVLWEALSNRISGKVKASRDAKIGLGLEKELKVIA